jgi:hypothetical protein
MFGCKKIISIFFYHKLYYFGEVYWPFESASGVYGCLDEVYDVLRSCCRASMALGFKFNQSALIVERTWAWARKCTSIKPRRLSDYQKIIRAWFMLRWRSWRCDVWDIIAETQNKKRAKHSFTNILSRHLTRSVCIRGNLGKSAISTQSDRTTKEEWICNRQLPTS